jgi:hypothetical protein
MRILIPSFILATAIIMEGAVDHYLDHDQKEKA